MKIYRSHSLLDGPCLTFREGDCRHFQFDTGELPTRSPDDYRFRLFVKGEPQTDAAVLSEWGGGLFLRDIDDSLSRVTHHSRYSLRFVSSGEAAPRRAYYKLLCSPLQYPGGLRIGQLPQDGVWHFSFYAKAEDFVPLGEAEVRAELFRRRENRNPMDISGEADEIIRIPFRTGTYDFCRTERELYLGDEFAAVLFTVSVGASYGTLYVEDVSLTGETDISLLPRFLPHTPYSETLNWFGENLSRHEWSDFSVALNGADLGIHPLFSSILRDAENEFPIDGAAFVSGINTLTLRYQPDYASPVPYRLREIRLLAQERHPFHLISCPHTAAVGERFALTVETEQPDLLLCVRSSCGAVVPEREELLLAEPGLHAVVLRADSMAGEVSVALTANGYTETASLARTVQRGRDGVMCGTSDAVYIPQREDSMREYLKWYLSNECGGFVTFRPVYHWSGTKSVCPELWRRMIPFLNELMLPYCLLFDERELEGLNANPVRELLEGPCFMGYQGHEVDGAYYYWSNSMWNCNGVFYRELRARNLCHPDVSYRMPVHYRGSESFVYRDPGAVSDVREADRYFRENVGAAIRGCRRHTGVTLLFRHFLQAGVEVPGAEVMYSSHEILLSGLRGSAYAYSKPVTVSHLALQWHSEPVGYPGFYERFELSLQVCYLHGVSHINTEEGLWHMEFGFESHDRFSEACRRNAEIQRKFHRFIACHTRRGSPAHLHGILFGSCDGYTSYSVCPVWNHDEPGWEYGEPERAWEHIRLFYPDAAVSRITDRVRVSGPRGWFSRTPYGLCDIIPVEAPVQALQAYPYLAFMGYHLADRERNEALFRYAEQGGTLLLCLCHLSDDADRSAAHAPLFASHLCPGYEVLTGFAVSQIHCKDGFRFAESDWGNVRVKRRFAWGTPLVLENRVGKGRILTVNSFAYPSHPAIASVYEQELRELAEAVKRGCADTGDIDTDGQPVEYAVYDLPGGGTGIYLVHTAWYGECDTVWVYLVLGSRRYRIPVVRGKIGIVTRIGDIAAYTCDDSTELLGLLHRRGQITVELQGEGDGTFRLIGPELSALRNKLPNREILPVWESDGVYRLQLLLCGARTLVLETGGEQEEG